MGIYIELGGAGDFGNRGRVVGGGGVSERGGGGFIQVVGSAGAAKRNDDVNKPKADPHRHSAL